MEARPPPVIEQDLSCRRCGYNLRTLEITARCPECGFPNLRTYIAAEAGVAPDVPLNATAVARTAMLVLARLLGRNVDAIHFVASAYRFALRNRPASRGLFATPASVSAADLCSAIADYALYHDGNRRDAVDTLRFWRIEGGEDVGQIVAGLVEAGLVQPAEGESPADFVGRFKLYELLPLVDRGRE